MARTNRDSRHKRQSWSDNPIVSSSVAALRQAMAPALDWCRLQKNIINKFNDKGRPEHVVEWEDFQCSVTQDGDRSRKSSKDGERSEVHFTITYLKPLRLQIGNILVHPTFGWMKIEGFDGMNEVGLTTARAIGINATEDVIDGDFIRPVPPTIF